MPEWVKNISSMAIPTPFAFTPEERRILFGLQRRMHLLEWDDKKKLEPLTLHERARLDEFQTRITNGNVVRYAGLELPFRPGEVIQVPDGFSGHIISQHPDKLARLTWKDVRNMDPEPRAPHFQTQEESRELIETVAAAQDSETAARSIYYEDGRYRMGDGPWLTAPSGSPKEQ